MAEMAPDLPPDGAGAATSELSEPNRIRTDFPETWIWSEVVTG